MSTEGFRWLYGGNNEAVGEEIFPSGKISHTVEISKNLSRLLRGASVFVLFFVFQMFSYRFDTFVAGNRSNTLGQYGCIRV